jgi:hypothetical protein
VGMFVSFCLLILSFLTFADHARILLPPIRRMLFILYALLLLYPHTCSSSYSLHGWRMWLKTLLFVCVWFFEDYYFAMRSKRDRFTQLWWRSAWTNPDYLMLVLRSLWILFVHEIFLLGVVFVAMFCVAELMGQQSAIETRTRKERDPETAVYDDGQYIEDVFSSNYGRNGTLVRRGEHMSNSGVDQAMIRETIRETFTDLLYAMHAQNTNNVQQRAAAAAPIPLPTKQTPPPPRRAHSPPQMHEETVLPPVTKQTPPQQQQEAPRQTKAAATVSPPPSSAAAKPVARSKIMPGVLPPRNTHKQAAAAISSAASPPPLGSTNSILHSPTRLKPQR